MDESRGPLIHVKSGPMSNAAPTTSLPPGQANKLAVLLDALDGVALSDGECASLTGWLDSSGPPWGTSQR